MADAPDTTTDPFEAELRSFRPVAPSAAVAQHIGAELARDAGPLRPARPGRPWRLYAGAFAAAAACLVGAVAVWRVTHSGDGIAHHEVVSIATLPALPATEVPKRSDDDGDDVDDRPSLASYRRALSRSPEDVDELLHRHAARLLPRDGYELRAAANAGTPAGLDVLRDF